MFVKVLINTTTSATGAFVDAADLQDLTVQVAGLSGFSGTVSIDVTMDEDPTTNRWTPYGPPITPPAIVNVVGAFAGVRASAVVTSGRALAVLGARES